MIKFIDIDPPFYDVDFGKGKGTDNSIASAIAMMNNLEMDPAKCKLACLGLSKGSIVFISLQNYQMIFTRMSYHRDRILAVSGIRDSKSLQKSNLLISLCIEGYTKIVTFKSGKPECLRTLNCHK